MVRAERVLEALVVRAGVDEVRGAELLHAAQALQDRRVHERERPVVERDGAVDGVPDGDAQADAPADGAP